jgi:hypothetical protein
MAKIPLDKYYTPQELADYCVRKTIEIIGNENITELVESSAGNGVFLNSFERLLPNAPYKAYDIEPEDDRIIKQDYLTLDLEYKQGRVCGFNFPYGVKNNLSKSFANKSFEIAEYVATILPISQLNNNQSIYKYDLIYSEDLKPKEYSGIKVHCCFNIYKKPIDKRYNDKVNYKDDKIIEIREIREVIKNNNPKRNRELGDFEHDMKILAWGTATNNRDIGCLLSDTESYAKTFYIKIKDKVNYDKIYNLILNAKWREIYPMTATPNLLQWQVYKYLKEQMIELE